MKKKIISILIVLIIVLNPVTAYADSVPGTVTVSGGSIGSGGIQGNSGVLKGTALAVVMATLASVGISVKLSAEDYARGNNAINYVQNKFEQWENNANAGWDAYQALDSTKIGANGELYIPEAASSVMQKFLNWLYANDAINYQQSSTGGQFGGAYNGVSWTNSAGAIFYFGDNVAGYMVAIKDASYSNNYIIVGFRETAFSWNKYYKGGTEVRSSYAGTVNGQSYEYCYYFEMISADINGLIDLSAQGYYGRSGFLQWLTGEHTSPDTNIENTGFYTENTDIPSLVDESGTGKILVVQPGLIPQVQDNYAGSNNTAINVQDYLDALKDLYGQQAIPQDVTDLPDITLQGVDATTGTKEDVAEIDRDIELVPEVTLPDDPDAITWPDVLDPAVPIAIPQVPAEPEVAIPAMSFDLTDYFPFCIPIDIYNLLSKLNADPVTPVITIDWGNILGSIGVDYEMTIDLSEYNNIASILRTMELFAFIIGLGVATRSMYIRG